MAEIPVVRKAGVGGNNGARAQAGGIGKSNANAPRWMWLLVALSAVVFLVAVVRNCRDTSVQRAGAESSRAQAADGRAGGAGNSNASAASGDDGGRADERAANGDGRDAAERERVDGDGDLKMFAEAGDRRELAGRRVDLENVRVARVLGDRVFTVKSGEAELYALLDENLDAGEGRERRRRVRRGQRLHLGGTFQPVPDDDDQRRGTEFRRLRGQDVYLRVTQIADAN